MRPFRIQAPPSHQKAFRDISSLPSAELEKLVRAVGSVEKLDGLKGLDVELTSAGFEDGPDWAAAISSAYAAQQQFRLSPKEMTNALTENMDLSQEATDNLVRVLDKPGMALLAKANDLGASYKNQLMTMRIVSDIRPVFPIGDVGQPTGAVVTHTIELAYESGDETHTRYISATLADLDTIAEQVDRAREKHRELKQFLATTGLNQYEVEG